MEWQTNSLDFVRKTVTKLWQLDKPISILSLKSYCSDWRFSFFSSFWVKKNQEKSILLALVKCETEGQKQK